MGDRVFLGSPRLTIDCTPLEVVIRSSFITLTVVHVVPSSNNFPCFDFHMIVYVDTDGCYIDDDRETYLLNFFISPPPSGCRTKGFILWGTMNIEEYLQRGQ